MRFLFSKKQHHASWRWHALLALVFIVALAIELFGLHALELSEARLVDVYQRRHAAELQPDPEIVVIDIDDASMVEMQEIAGLWAWPREIHADLIEGLNEFAPRAIVFDMTFSVRDVRRPASDARLNEVVQSSNAVYLAASRLASDGDTKGVNLAPLAAAFGMAASSGVANAQAAIELPQVIESKAWRLGLINSRSDEDGNLRRYPLYTEVQGWRLPSLPARIAGDYLSRQASRLPSEEDFLMRWSSSLHRHYSYGVLYKTLTQERFSLAADERRALDNGLASLFHDKIIVIGSSASSSFDHHVTPLGSNIPGADILAVAIDNLKNQQAVRSLPVAVPFLFGVVLIIALAWAFARRRNPMMIGLALALTSLLILVAADTALSHNLLLPIVTPLVLAWSWYLLAAIGGYLRERRARDQAVSLFGRFLNPNVVQQIVEQGETVESLSGRTSEVSVLFSDIRGFTSLSESRDPHEVVDLLNRYFELQVEVVFRHGGTLDKFIGDCIMAFWGAPVADPKHAANAVAAAMEMQEVLLEFKKELQGEGADIAAFDVGIGVHSGPAVVGFIGAKKKLDYTAIGDTVNLASRVEGLTKDVARVLVTRETMQACGADANINFLTRGAFAVKGRVAAVELFEPIRKS